MARILEIDPPAVSRRVAGVVLDTLRAAAEKHHLTFAPPIPPRTTAAPSAA